MTLSTQFSVRIAAPATAGPLSPARKKFNSLVKKLEAERVKLALWRDELPKIRALAGNEYRPLAEEFDVYRRQFLLTLDMAYDDKAMSKKDKEKLQDLICQTALVLMQADEDDEEVKDIYSRHSGRDFDEDMDEEKESMRTLVGLMTGVELDEDTDMSSPAAFFTAMREKMAERARDEELAESTRPDGATAKPAKLSAREARHQAEEAKLKQSVREIFRKLASALHPDRETDPAEHTRKTALMQRANVAYGANDLLGLLELQLEVDQIDRRALEGLSDDRIKQYNRILDGQVKEIASEIQAMECAVSLDMGWEFGRLRTPQAMLKVLRGDIAGMRANINHIKDDLVTFADVKRRKAWLKGYTITVDESMYADPWF